ncbi:MAG: nickel pincer cofactor biosynthesis protein LarB [Candidatus Omnitrophica bacterium]|nr:nickel pincer cofactor biosynthesis protein LarB [Candidatus Omnitrophota bacterium]MDD5166880.1 nickel pincer cofactor biosynthesis protein LarB [Candidatus Omnitrophota bacterium]
MVLNPGFCDLGFAKVDVSRRARRGFSEAVYCPGKTKEGIKEISRALLKDKQDLLLTRLDKPTFAYLKRSFPRLKYNPSAKLGYLKQKDKTTKRGLVAVISAGTADMPVAEEAATTCEVMGSRVAKFYDVGVAGVHRVLKNIETIRKAKVIIVVAGMEGALASLISGLVASPVIAVPTSCGYGASFGGLAALLTMLNSCSPGVTVVNIDNGFGAGYFASLINK